MRLLSRLAVLATLTAAALVPTAHAKNTAAVALSPNKGGSVLLAQPTTFKVTVVTPDQPYDPSGNTLIKAITVNLPEQLLFNTQGFPYCDAQSFIVTKSCPASTKLGTAIVEAYGGPDIRQVQATTDLYFGNGFTILARIRASAPAVIDVPSIGSLRSSNARGHGLQMYIPVPGDVSEPIRDIFPTVTSITASVRPKTRRISVPGRKRKVRMPIAGIGICTGPMNFNLSVVYTDAGGLIDKIVDGAAAQARCRK